jgi:hypothetical protein
MYLLLVGPTQPNRSRWRFLTNVLFLFLVCSLLLVLNFLWFVFYCSSFGLCRKMTIVCRRDDKHNVFFPSCSLWTVPCRGEGACVFPWNRELCRPEFLLLAGPTKPKRSRWRFLTNVLLFLASGALFLLIRFLLFFLRSLSHSDHYVSE